MERRDDVGQKVFIGIITAVLTTIFISSLGFSIRAYEIGNVHEVRLAKIDSYIDSQEKLNLRLEKFLDKKIWNSER